MIILLKAVFYIALVAFDSFILWILTFFNPYYGSNSPEDLFMISNLVNDISYIVENINKNSYKFNEMIDGGVEHQDDDIDNIYSKIKEDFHQFVELLQNIHTHFFNIIING